MTTCRRTFSTSTLTAMARGVVMSAVLVGSFGQVEAQFTTGRLGGTVADNAGDVIPGAVVTVRDASTGYTQTVKTSAQGGYLFPSLPVGTYELTIAQPGFGNYVQKGISLAVGQTATQNVELKVGQVSDQVVVTADSTLVTTDSSMVGQLIPKKDIVQLPLNGRAVQQLVFLAAGAQNVTSHYCSTNCEGGVFPGEQYAKVNGAGANGVNYQLDGVDYNDTYINTNLPFPNPDAIQEFNLLTGNMSASYGNAIGGVVNVVTQSGTNAFHGDVFEFIRNSVFDAADYFSPEVNPLHQNQFGASLGGPILRKRLFFFGSYQGTRFSTQNNGQIAFVPNAAERTGDFSDLLPDTQLVNPATGAAYANNQIPVSPVATYILNQIPLPNGPNDQLTFNGGPDRQDTNEYLGKLDLNAGSHHLSGRYFQMNYTDPVFVPPSTNLLQLRANAEALVLKNIGIVDIYTISPRFLLNSYFGYNSENGDTLSSAPFNMAQAGVNIAQPPSLGGGKGPTLDMEVGGAFTLPSVPYGIWNRGDQSLREIANWTKGSSDLQFGGEFVRVRLPMGNQYQASGHFAFTSDLTGSNLADFESGALSSFTQGGGLYLDVTGYRESLFVQEDWKVNPRLTLNAGLRWDPFFPYQDSEGRVACFVPGAHSDRFPNAPEGMLFGGSDHDPGCPKSSIYSNPLNFAPRFGFAYQATQDGKTSVRGGIGYYFEPPNTVAFEDVVDIPPFAPVLNLTDVSLSDPYGSAGVANPFPASFGPTNPTSSATFPADIGFNQIFDRHFQLPMVLAYNLTVEREIGRDTLLRLAYVGNNGHHLSGTGDQEDGLLQLNPAVYLPGQSTEANTQQRRLYPAFGSIASINSGVNTNYNGAQVSVEKRFRQSWSFLADFTWSKSLDDFAPIGSPYLTNSCSCGRYFDYGPSDDDISKAFKVNADYTVPNLHLHSFLNAVVSGWEVSGLASWNAGFPFTIFSGYDNSFSAIGADRADLAVANVRAARLGGGRSHTDELAEWFNTSAFQPNAVGSFGNTGKNVLRGPGYFSADTAAIKTTTLKEGFALELRAEAYNALNHVNFGNPDGVLTDPGFGQITGLAGGSSANPYGTAQPRVLQFGAKIKF